MERPTLWSLFLKQVFRNTSHRLWVGSRIIFTDVKYFQQNLLGSYPNCKLKQNLKFLAATRELEDHQHKGPECYNSGMNPAMSHILYLWLMGTQILVFFPFLRICIALQVNVRL